MVISLDSKPRKVREWFENHVYKMYKFRILVEQEKEARDPQEKKRLNNKSLHPGKEAMQHTKHGEEDLKIDGDQIREFNQAIIEEVRKRKTPKEIIQTLIKENGQN